MAYVFTVETGENIPGSNSYVTVEEATDYLDQNIHAGPLWAALTVLQQQYLLSWASRYLDQNARWYGKQTYPDQSMRHPRTGLKDRDGTPLPPDEIAKQLKEATIEMARFLVDGDRGAPSDIDAIKKLKVDVIELIFRDNYVLPSIPENLKNIITGLGYLLGGTSGYAKIRRA